MTHDSILCTCSLYVPLTNEQALQRWLLSGETCL